MKASCCLTPAKALEIALLLTLSRVPHFSAISFRTSSKSLNSRFVFLIEIPILFSTLSTSLSFSEVSVDSESIFNLL